MAEEPSSSVFNRRAALRLAAGGSAAALLAACSGSSNAGSSPTMSAGTTNATSAMGSPSIGSAAPAVTGSSIPGTSMALGQGSAIPTTASTSVAATGKKIVVESTWGKTDPRLKAQQQIAALFTDQTGIEVQLLNVPFESNDKALLRKVASGQQPDISQQFDISLLSLSSQSALAPLDSYVSDFTAAQKDDYLTPWEDMVFDGHLYGVRYSTQPGNGFIYRKSIYDQAGITAAPKTFDQWKADCVKVTSGSRYGVSLPFITTGTFTRPTAMFSSMMWAMGGDLTNADYTAPTFQDASGVAAAQWIQDRIYVDHTMPKSVATLDENPLDSQFVAGLVVSTVANTSNPPEYQASGATDATLAPFPNFANDASKPGPAFCANGWTLCVPKGAQVDLAWEFLNFYQSPTAQLINMKVGQQLPTRKSVLSDPFFATPAAAVPKMIIDWITANPHAAPVHVPNYPDLKAALGAAFQKIITQKADPSDALKDAASQYAATLK